MVIDVDYNTNIPEYVYFRPGINVFRSPAGFHYVGPEEILWKNLLSIANEHYMADRIDLLNINESQYRIQAQLKYGLDSELRIPVPGHEIDNPAVKKFRSHPVGSRFPKTDCPSGSHKNEPDPNPPVVVYPDGVYCFNCGGYWPFSISASSATLADIVRYRVHVDQLLPFLFYYTNYLLNLDNILKAYKAVLADYGPEDEVKELSTPIGVYYTEDKELVNNAGVPISRGQLRETALSMPYCYKWIDDDNGKRKRVLDKIRLNAILNGNDLEPYFITVSTNFSFLEAVIHGFKPHKIISEFYPYFSGIKKTTIKKDIISKINVNNVNDYSVISGESDPTPYKQVIYGVLFERFFNCDTKMSIIITGASGSGKSTLVKVVSEIFGGMIPVDVTQEKERVLSIFSSRPVVVYVDEFNKHPTKCRELILSLDRDSMPVRRLYDDPVALKDVKSAVIFSGIEAPLDWRGADKQVFRRCIFISMPPQSFNPTYDLVKYVSDNRLRIFGIIKQMYQELKEWFLNKPANINGFKEFLEVKTGLRIDESKDESVNFTLEQILLMYDMCDEVYNSYEKWNGYFIFKNVFNAMNSTDVPEHLQLWAFYFADRSDPSNPGFYSSDKLLALNFKEILGVDAKPVIKRYRTALLITFKNTDNKIVTFDVLEKIKQKLNITNKKEEKNNEQNNDQPPF